MIYSNNPLFLRDQDHLAKHADMIEAARAEPHRADRKNQDHHLLMAIIAIEATASPTRQFIVSWSGPRKGTNQIAPK